MRNLKPSQIGLLNIPQNPNQRGADRSKREYLDKLNEKDERGVTHPTKGWRKISLKRARAAALVDGIKSGQVPFDTEVMADYIRLGRL